MSLCIRCGRQFNSTANEGAKLIAVIGDRTHLHSVVGQIREVHNRPPGYNWTWLQDSEGFALGLCSRCVLNSEPE